MGILVVYADRTGAGLKAAKDIASLLGAEAASIEPTSRLVKMSWLALLGESRLQAWEPFAGKMLVVVAEGGEGSLAEEISQVISRTRSLRSGYALVEISTGGSRESAALIERSEAAAGRRPTVYFEASAREVIAEGKSRIWRAKLERLRLALMG